MRELDRKKLMFAAGALVMALLSMFVLSKFASSARFHAATLAALEEKQATVLELTAASTAASAAITLIPGDTATPIAEKLADLSTGFLVVLCAIYLEKYLLTITGFAAFHVLIPIACLLFALSLFVDWETPRLLARKLLVFGIAIVLVIPASVKVSDLIDQTYQDSIQATIQAAKDTAGEAEDSQAELEEDGGFWDGLIGKVTSGITGAANQITEKVGGMVNDFIEALAVMLVTACLIPILVLLFFVWLVKITFSIELPAGGRGGFRAARKGRSGPTGPEE